MEFRRIKRLYAIPVPGLRFKCYNAPVLPSGNDWVARCEERTLLVLYVNAAYPTMTNRNKINTVYKDLIKRFSEHCLYVGKLTMNHSLALLAAVGLLPRWIREHAEITPGSRYMKWFADEYPLPKPLNIPNLDRILSTVRVAL
jgi:hypothetical protein